jgi:hypothetical protein
VLGALLALALAQPARAADILVPDPVARELNDLSVSFMFAELVVSAMRDGGLDVEDAEAIRRWAGPDADECAASDNCPAVLWPRTNARLAVVIVAGRTDGELDVEVRLHGADDASPFKVIRKRLPPGSERLWATEVARTAREALRVLPQRSVVVPPVVEATRDATRSRVATNEGSGEGEADTAGEPSVAEAASDAPGASAPTAPPPTAPPPVEPKVWRPAGESDERRAMGIPAGAYRRYAQSGLSAQDWLRTARVRSGKVFFELVGGWAAGDTDRGYGVRLRLQPAGAGFERVGTRTWEGDGAGTGFNGALHVGYAPAWFLDTALGVGVQQGRKHLDTGWECLDAMCDPSSGEDRPAPVAAVQFLIEPRVRVYPVATGVVKPYLLAACTLRVYDGFTVPDLDQVDYPNASGGAAFGPTGGLGVAIDAVSPLSIFVEAPYTYTVTPTSRSTSDGTVTLAPDGLPQRGGLLRVTGGVAVRF